jgi:hypothetical protein
MTYANVKKIKPLVLNIDKRNIFSEDMNQFFIETAPLSENYKEFLKTWLFATPPEDSDFKFEWHSKKELTMKNFKNLQEKCWCILCEQAMSAHAVELGFPIIKINDEP